MKQFDKNATFLDVRTKTEYNEGHIPGAINIPLHQLQGRIHEIKAMKTPVVVYCRSGNRSEMAAFMLRQKGLQNVMDGRGIEALKKLIND